MRGLIIIIASLFACEQPDQCVRYVEAANECIAVTQPSVDPTYGYDICDSDTSADSYVYACMADVYETAECTDLAGFIAIELALQACSGANG